MSSAKKKFDSLQVFRGLAALGVVIRHTAISTDSHIASIPAWLDGIFKNGFLGVDFFFVLSGFIIMSSHFNDEKSVAAWKTYGFKRFVRIFPPYWPIAIALMLSYIFLPSLGQETRHYSVLSSLLLLPDYQPPALIVAWTLIHEVLFYLIFCLFFISNRVFLIFLACWVFAIGVTASHFKAVAYSPFFTVLLHPINLEFVFGMCTAYLATKTSKHLGIPLIFLGFSTFALLLLWPFAYECRFLFGLSFSALVLGSVLLEHGKALPIPRWMVLIGDASYSIYLIHNPLNSVTGRLIGRFQGFATWGVGMLVGVISSIIAGVIYHFIIEKPLIRLFRRGKEALLKRPVKADLI
ncbi:MAG: acyltransferase [Pseudomonadota bacterium]